MMKKGALLRAISVVLLGMILGVSALLAQNVDPNPPVARIEYYKTQVISTDQFRKLLGAATAGKGSSLTFAEKKQLLNTAVSQAILGQEIQHSLKNKDIAVSAKDNQRVSQYMAAPFFQATGTIPKSQKQLEAFYTKNHLDLKQRYQSAQFQLLVEKYIKFKNPDVLQGVSRPTEKQISNYYNGHATQFVQPDLVRFSQVFFGFDGGADKATLQKQVNKVYSQIKNGKLTFTEAVRKYSTDPISKAKGGDFGFIGRSNGPFLKAYGSGFSQKIFAHSPGDPVFLAESSKGYHIVKVTDYLKKRFLALSDPITPTPGPQGRNQTIHDVIANNLYTEKKSAVLAQAAQTIVKKLVSNVDPTYYYSRIKSIS